MKEIEGTWGNEQAAAYLGCTPNTLRVWVSQGKVPSVRLGRLRRYRKKDLDDFLEQHFVPAST